MHDLISFLGVLGTAVLLVCVGHVAPANIAVIAAGLGTLFAAWRSRDRHDDHSGTKAPNADDKLR
jgi:hypothetical protein